MKTYTFGICPNSYGHGPFTAEIQEDCEISAFNVICKMVRETYPPNDGTAVCLLNVKQES